MSPASSAKQIQPNNGWQRTWLAVRRTSLDKKPLLVALALAGFRAAVVCAQLSASDQADIQRYRAAITSAGSGASRGGVEAAFAALESVREALLRVRDGGTVLESLSDQEYRRLQRELPGAVVNRDEIVFVAPELAYFGRVAAARGDAADRGFFGALKATYPKGVWEVYVTQQTDYSGCTRFGSMSLVATYRAWTEFQQKYPARYATPAKKEVEAVLEALTQSTCACGDMAGVERELQQFVRVFPSSPARKEVERRLDAARAGRSNIRVKCASG